MASIRCPHCGAPVMLRGCRWECGYCGDFGSISSLQPSEKAKLAQARASSVRITVTVTATSQEEEAPFSPACTAPEAAEVSCFSRAVLEDMVRRWDLEQNEWACRDLLIAAFPQATGRWSAEELAEMDTMDLLVETGRQDPETALRMVELLLSTAEGHLQEPEAANQLLGWDMSDLLVSEEMLPLLVRELRKNGRLARQLFQSAYVGRPQEELLNACGRMGEWELQQRLLELLARNPFPHDAPELEPEESFPGRSPYHGPQPEG